MYQVQFISSGKVAFSANERAICKHWIDCNNYSEDKPLVDDKTGEIVPGQWIKGDCLNLFILKQVCSVKKVK